ncbi:MAG: zinc ribbon domain-containing protein, partial [Cyanobacteria bacterium P01_D01_bin.116]
MVVVKVNPRNTSKQCSNCGHIKQDLTLADRFYHCENCGKTMCRDLNAS